jgi:hypothetical protein
MRTEAGIPLIHQPMVPHSKRLPGYDWKYCTTAAFTFSSDPNLCTVLWRFFKGAKHMEVTLTGLGCMVDDLTASSNFATFLDVVIWTKSHSLLL